MTEESKVPGMGHNNPPLEDWIFQHEHATSEAVFAVLVNRLKREKSEEIASLSKTAKDLAANLKRIPDVLDDDSAPKAYDLIAAIGAHEERVEELREAVVSIAKSTLSDLTQACKPIDDGIAKLDKKLRPLIIDRLVAKIDRHDSERIQGEPLMTTISEQGRLGSKASVSVKWKNEIVDPDLVPEKYRSSIPDQSKIDEAVEAGTSVPGVERRRDPALRISK